MIEEVLQDWLDRARVAADVRWVLGAVATLSVVVASVVTDIASPGGFVTGTVVFALLAALAAAQAASHLATAVVALILLQWVGSVDDVTDARAPVVATCLLVFHSTLALMAVTPHSAPVPSLIIRRWVQRLGVVTIGTFGVWGVVLVLERREAAGNVILTVAAVALLGASAVAVRNRSIG